MDLTYWGGTDAYAAHDPEARGGDWRMANATARALFAALQAEGYEVRWRDAPTE